MQLYWWFLVVVFLVIVLCYQCEQGWVEVEVFVCQLVFEVWWVFLICVFDEYVFVDELCELFGQYVVCQVELCLKCIEVVVVEECVVEDQYGLVVVEYGECVCD